MKESHVKQAYYASSQKSQQWNEERDIWNTGLKNTGVENTGELPLRHGTSKTFDTHGPSVLQLNGTSSKCDIADWLLLPPGVWCGWMDGFRIAASPGTVDTPPTFDLEGYMDICYILSWELSNVFLLFYPKQRICQLFFLLNMIRLTILCNAYKKIYKIVHDLYRYVIEYTTYAKTLKRYTHSHS